MIVKALIERIYDAAFIERWNDHVRPVQFTELDKQAHKAIFAYVLARFEEDAGNRPVDWTGLIEGGIFEFLHRVTLTDIKPAVFHEMMSRKGEALNDWVVGRIDDEIRDLQGGFKEKFLRYFADPDFLAREKHILRAAHYLATNWEFKVLYPLNSMLYGTDRTRDEIERRMEDFYDLRGVREILLRKEYYGFLDLCGQLRFQQRWAQAPRIPRTSVLGHMFIVALLAYFVASEIGFCRKRVYNDFYSSLFHDLPEVLTRDIISPIKTSIEGLGDIIKDYEKKQIDEKILPLLPKEWEREMRYFIENEFENRVLLDGRMQVVGDIREEFNDDEYSPVDGRIIEVCDKFAAYIEASLSIRYGIRSLKLAEGKEKLYRRFGTTVIRGFDFSVLFDYFA